MANSAVKENGHEVKVTISVGGTMAQPEDNVELLLQRADKNLYASKKAGRDTSTVC